MSILTIENSRLKVEMVEKGAELTSIQSKGDGTEFLWQADAAYWGRHAPILFPIVGKLKDDRYEYEGQTYSMSQHGFARDMDFTVVEKNPESIRLSLMSTSDTQKRYPFDFQLEVEYLLEENCLRTRYIVTNSSDKNQLFFSVGAHPGFKVPLEADQTFEDYWLEILPEKARKIIPITKEVLLQTDQLFETEQTRFDLTRELFKEGVLILETSEQTQVALRSQNSQKAIVMQYRDMPYLGIWSPFPSEAPFVCIEPWNGIADPSDASGRLEDKKGICRLAPGERFDTEYRTTFVDTAGGD
ncbi:aldose 1-epimerase [Enterococcus florum]|uniref:Aldose 1-epimerase n=1 Tax=Enterococcus florum TaxID=2480627 RepID=A0A4P5P8F6_9ENTE|nr:aldose 1-epimerase family protein [Enterococcus florum]GCF92554.1 aldose 1-epimerase [Enterococcus florum]